ncbi:hypothetical protein EEW87_004335 [Janibacter melonis]|uniref:DNA primase/polymerase bifunctional N-terminal domain-containing protein n=1 Tax=Janibacter melonis TaxID=262209 RepID=A0A5P8FJN1_9MICO|nr:bifunctional DNA primase/polymerase [Janibacter melonis]QFQ29727.2 hypothetical protein EEW87_004335 [Janibacter melonis]
MTPDLLATNDMTVGEAAAQYMRLGFPVFAVKPGGKQPDTPHGFKDAIVAPEQKLPGVALLWDRASWNIGLPTGSVFDVLDVDVKDGKPGRFSLRKLEKEGLLNGAVAHAETPSGGLHLFFPASGARGGSIPSAGLDFKALGGYVVAAPSDVLDITDSGALDVSRYRWTWARGLGEGHPIDWDACRQTLGAPTSDRTYRAAPSGLPVEDTVAGLSRWLVSQPNNRNSALFWAAKRAVEEGACTEDQLKPLVAASLTLSTPGETREEELWKTVRSALRH